MKQIVAAALALATSLTLVGNAYASTWAPIPNPTSKDIGEHYGRYHAQHFIVVVARRELVAKICPAHTGGRQLINGQVCEPFSIGPDLTWRMRLHAGGYIISRGHRFYFVDLGTNQFGGHDYGWLYGPDLWSVAVR